MKMMRLISVLGLLLAWSVSAPASQAAQLNREIQQLQYAMLRYVVDNPMPSAAVLAAGGGASTFVVEHMDRDTRAALRAVGAMGMIYCLWSRANAATCDDALSELTYLARAVSDRQQRLAGR